MSPVSVGVLGPVSERVDSQYDSLVEDIVSVFMELITQWVGSHDNSSVDSQDNSWVEDLVSIYGDHSSHWCCTQWLSLVDMAHMSEAIDVFGVVGCC